MQEILQHVCLHHILQNLWQNTPIISAGQVKPILCYLYSIIYVILYYMVLYRVALYCIISYSIIHDIYYYLRIMHAKFQKQIVKNYRLDFQRSFLLYLYSAKQAYFPLFLWDTKPLYEVKPCFFTRAWSILAWKPGLLIDCFKMIDNFQFTLFPIVFQQKNIKLIVFPIVCYIIGVYFGKPDCLFSTNSLRCFRKPVQTLMSSGTE